MQHHSTCIGDAFTVGPPPTMTKCSCECHPAKPLISLACSQGQHEPCWLDKCECGCHQLAADGQPKQVENRCRDCSDGNPCMRLLCTWCWGQYGILGLRQGKLKDTAQNPRPPRKSDKEMLDWVRSLNPKKAATAHAPRLVGVRPTMKPLSGACGIEPTHHSFCKDSWCKCVCHDTNKSETASLACTAQDHDKCDKSWCDCQCHPKNRNIDEGFEGRGSN